MARILYTSVDAAGRAGPGFEDAADLSTAERRLVERGHTQIRFWSHPHLGDAGRHTPEAAFASAARPSTTAAWMVAGLTAATLPGSIAFWLVAVLGLPLDDRSPEAIALVLVVVGSFLSCLFLLTPCFFLLRRELNRRNYRVAFALLWLLRVGLPPVAPLWEMWAVRIRAGRHGLEASLRPYGFAPRIASYLRREALDQLQLHDERIELLRASVEASPSVLGQTDLALAVALHHGDATGARAILRRTGDAPTTEVVAAGRLVVEAICAIEERDPISRDRVSAARRAMTRLPGGVGHTWQPLFDVLEARALAITGSVDEAERAFRRAVTALLWGGDHSILDRAARDLDRASAARTSVPAARP